ncbi:ABC transporter transmembrane domain-containing protein [Solitalea sp. MAHUQ-68]|uniref:ABC transporter transmembrane domain-containing protein n=1 Tax=Solitalea agri TaxID=2953739 RepID=A0A9X2JEX8_9SPHI|nr:ABC transporter transmembrane domain-containing protein [Solitalea agri]MCO4294400.1 ABC transporter transmembrane domain-containing protein [Solitalea agri]
MARQRLNSSNPAEQELPKAKISKESLQHALTLLKYIKPYRAKFGLGLFFLIGSTVAFMYIPMEMGKLVGVATESIKKGDLTQIKEIALVLFGTLAFAAVFSFFRILWFVEVSEKTVASIRKDVYSNLIRLPMNFFAQSRVGELNSRISSDLSQIQDSITTTLAEFLRQSIILIVGIVAVTIISKELTLFILCVLPVLILIAIFFGKYIRSIARKAQDKLAESNTIVEETLQGIANVKAFTNESYETNRYTQSINQVVKLALRGAKFRGAFVIFITLGMFGAIISIAVYGASLVHLGKIEMKDFISFILYTGFVGGAMGGFAEILAQIQKTLGATERVVELLGEPSEQVAIDEDSYKIEHPIKGDLAFDRVSFYYPSRPEVQVLNEVSFTAKAGEKVAIVGPSGAGKSTIVGQILRFYEPQQGQLLYDGLPASAYSLTDIRNQVAIVPQDVLLFGGSIKENIAYGKIGATDEEIIQAAKRANAHNFIMNFPEGYETKVGERGVKLSGGQRQRIAIARALLKNPVILILDEATSSLDSESERLVQEALEELMKNRTSIIIAHRLSTIREADKIVVLEKGKVIEQGTHNELILKDNGLYRYLSELQLES